MEKDNFSTCLGMIVSMIVLIVVGTVVDGWALKTVWNWFIPSIFNITSLTLWQAMGVSMVFELFTRTNRNKKNDTSKTSGKTFGEIFVTSLIEVVLTPVLSVGIAWIIFNLAF
jgi:hypothetical protein